MSLSAIDRNSPIPYYIQLKEAILTKIENGEWQPGNQIPSEPELCTMFDVSRTVIRQALKDMEYEGLIVREKGKGTFIAEPKIKEGLFQSLTGFYHDMERRGLTTVSKVLKQEVVTATPKVAGYLNLSPGALVIEIQRLRFIQNEPIVLVTTYLPYSMCPKLIQVDLTHRSLYDYIESECNLFILRGRRVMEAVAANEYEAEQLQVQEGAPMLLINSVSYLSDGKPVEYYHAVHRGDRSSFEVELLRVREHGNARGALEIESSSLPPGSDILTS